MRIERLGISRVGFVVLGALGIALLVSVYLTVAAYRAEPVGIEDFSGEWNALLMEVRPEGANAREAYAAIDERIQEVDASWQDAGAARLPASLDRAKEALRSGAWDDPRRRDEKWLWKQKKDLLPRIVEASRMARLVDGFRVGGYGTPLPEGERPTARVSGVMDLLSLAVRAAAARGDWEAVERYVLAGMRIARQFGTGLFRHSVRTPGYAAWTWESLRKAIVAHEAPPAVCDRLIERISSFEIFPYPMRVYVEANRIYNKSLLGSQFDSEGRLVTWVDDPLVRTGNVPEWAVEPLNRLSNVLRYGAPRLADVEEAMDAIYARVAEEIVKAPREWGPVIGAPGSAAAEFAEEAVDAGVGLLFMQKEIVAEERAATLLMLRLEKHHAETGTWPESLEDALPREQTLNPATGAPFVYRLASSGEDSEGNPVGAYGLWPLDPGSTHARPWDSSPGRTRGVSQLAAGYGELDPDLYVPPWEKFGVDPPEGWGEDEEE